MIYFSPVKNALSTAFFHMSPYMSTCALPESLLRCLSRVARSPLLTESTHVPTYLEDACSVGHYLGAGYTDERDDVHTNAGYCRGTPIRGGDRARPTDRG